MLEEKQNGFERREIIIGCRARDGSAPAPRANDWWEDARNRTMGRIVSIPEGMMLAEGLRTLGDYSDSEIDLATELYPEPLHVATMLVLKR
jgi:hypothetical protein